MKKDDKNEDEKALVEARKETSLPPRTISSRIQ